jgi:hypothetical protein
MDTTERFKTPDTIIGIGGAGKEVVYQMMSVKEDGADDQNHNEWILREMMEPRTGDEDIVSEEVFQGYIVETEQEDAKTDIRKCNQINNRISDIAEEYDAAVYEPELNYLNAVEDAQVQGHELVSETVVNDFKTNTNLDCWWFGGSDIDTKENYSNGVVRRRALGKALYYASRAGSDPIHDMIRDADKGRHVDIVVGLGGGTGSGMFLDIARSLYENAEVETNLFGILPKDSEDTDKQANAFAALSELEYLSATDQNPFRNIVLIPYDPAEDDRSFDDAVVNAILAHANVRNTNIPRKFDPTKTAGPAPYAPFTIAVPQIIRYDAPGIKKSRENFESFVTERDSIRETEWELYESTQEYLEDYHGEIHEQYTDWGDADGYRLREEEINDLADRISEIEDLLSLDALSRSGYDAAPEIAETLRSLKNDEIPRDRDFDEDDHEERKRAIVNELPDTFVDNQLGRPTGGFERSEDQDLYSLVKAELETVRERRELFKSKNMMSSGMERDAMQAALRTTSQGTSDRRKVKDQAKEHARSASDLQDQSQDLKLGHALADEKLTQAMTSWKEAHEATVENLINLEENYEEIDSLLTELEKEIESTAAAVRDPEGGDVAIQSLDFGEFDRLNNKLAEVGFDELSQSDIRQSVRNLRKARQAWLDEERGGLIDLISRIMGSSDPANRYATAARKIKPDIYEFADWGPTSNEFYATVKATPVKQRQQQLEKRRGELIDDLLESLESYVEYPNASLTDIADIAQEGDYDPESLNIDSTSEADLALNDRENITSLSPLGYDPYGLRDNLKTALNASDANRVGELLNELMAKSSSRVSSRNVVYQAFEKAYLEPFTSKLAEVKEDLDTERENQNQFSDLDDILETGIKLWQHYEDRMEASDIPDSGERKEEDGPYIKTRSAEDRGALFGRSDISQAELWEDEEEYIRSYIKEVADLVDKQSSHLPLEKGSISHKDADRPNYDQFAISPVYMSRMFEKPYSIDEPARIEEVANLLDNGSIHLDQNGQYRPRRAAFGGPWDIATTVFVGGIMLDNLRPVKKQYKSSYETERRNLGDDGLIRHVHGLDGIDDGSHDLFDGSDGAFVHRDSLYNFNNNEDRLFVLDNDETKILKDILEKYSIDRFDSKVSLDRTDEGE